MFPIEMGIENKEVLMKKSIFIILFITKHIFNFSSETPKNIIF